MTQTRTNVHQEVQFSGREWGWGGVRSGDARGGGAGVEEEGGGVLRPPHVSQAIRSVLSKDRDFVLCGEAGLGGLLKVELLEAVE